MSRPILSTTIASLFANIILAQPLVAFGERSGAESDHGPAKEGAFGGGEGKGAAEDRADQPSGINDGVQGEEPPDFSFLDGPTEPPASEATPPAAPPASEQKPPAAPATPPPAATPPPEPPKEGGKPPKVPVKDPNDDLPIPPVKPQADGSKDEPMPPTPDEQAKIDADKKKAEEAAAAAKAEADKKVADANKKPEEGYKAPDDAEIEALSLKPGAAKPAITDFKNLKENYLKPAVAEVKRLKDELEKAKTAPGLTPELQKQLDQAKEDRAWRETFDTANDPVLKTEWDAKTAKADEDLYAYLKSPPFNMTDGQIDTLKKQGLDSQEGKTSRQRIIDAVKKWNDDIALDELKDAFKGRDAVYKQRDSKFKELSAGGEALQKAREEKEKGERITWATEVDKHMFPLIQEHPFLHLKEKKQGMTQEEEQAVDAWNKNLMEVRVPEIQAGVRALHTRDPKATSAMLIASIALPEVTKARDAALAEVEKLKQRVAELESDGAAVRRVSQVSHVASPAAPVSPSSPSATSAARSNGEESADDAIDAYRREKGLMPGQQQ